MADSKNASEMQEERNLLITQLKEEESKHKRKREEEHSFRKQIEQLKATISCLETLNKELQGVNCNYESYILCLVDEKWRLNETIKELLQKCDDLRSELREKQSHIHHLNEKINDKDEELRRRVESIPEQLTGLASSVSALSLASNVKMISSGNSGFPLPGALNSFSIASSGSPAKMLTAPSTPAVSSVNQIAHPFPRPIPSVSSQLPAQSSSQLGGDFGAICPDSSQPVSKDIEDEANSYFQRIYNHSPQSSLQIDEVLEMLKRFQDSPVKRERDVFNCMIRNVFEEYMFFSQYPDKKLITTAQLFGGIIDQNLVSVEECRNNMVQIGMRNITPQTVARILSMMTRLHTGLTEAVPVQNMNSNSMIMWNDNKEKSEGNQQPTWNVDIFVQVVHDMAPNLDWKEVVSELDNPGFLLKDKKGFKMLWQALLLGLGHETFPMERIYRRWRYSEGQFSFFQQSLNCSDIMCFTDFTHRPVLTDALKAPPEDDNRSISNWKSLDLIESLLYLSETSCFKDEIFKFPLSHCPDLLILGLIQSTKTINILHKELLSTLIPVFLGNHPNSAMVLHLVWHSQHHQAPIRNIVMHAMADWYMRGDCDQTRLSRILDVAQDLKALSMLLNLTPFMFVIDLACLASRREYLKLDKWIGDKVREHGETFIQACVAFLTRRCPQIMGGSIKEENLPKSALPPETLAAILSLLHTLVGSISQELSETILTMVGNCGVVLTKNRLPPPGVVKTSQGLQSVLSSTVINSPNTSLEQLTGLTSSVSALSLASNVKTISSGNSGFPLPGALNSFSIASSGSPAKMLTAPSTPAVSSVNQTAQNPFPRPIPSVSSQLPAQSSSQLGGDFGAIFPDSSQPVSKDIADEANSYFQRIYNHSPQSSLQVDEVLEMLKRFQHSPVKRERDVFNCMIRNLFEEYRFFPQYPDKKLITTAQLFGGIIDQNLVSFVTLGLALRYVLDSLKKPQGSKMFYFGVTAMDKFKSRLKDYPQYCQHLTSIPTFQDMPAQLIEYIEYGARSQEPPNRSQGPIIPPTLTVAPAFPVLTQSPSLPITTTTDTFTVTTASTNTTLAGKLSAKLNKLTTELKDEKKLEEIKEKAKLAVVERNQLEEKLNRVTKENQAHEKKLSQEIVDLQEQVRDLMFRLDAKDQLQSVPAISQEEIQEGQIVIGEAAGSSSKTISKPKRKKRTYNHHR